jgi:hypothetical protein
MCVIDLEPCSVWRETPRKAKKSYKCSGCGITIQPGEAYLENFSVFEGEASTEKACFGCWAAKQQFAEAHGQDFAPSHLIEFLQDCIGENDDEEDVWRPVLAAVLARYRTSDQRRSRLAERREARV